MASLPQSDFQARLFAILGGDAALTALLGASRIFDQVPDNQAYPYVTIGDEDFTDGGSHTAAGFEGDVTVHTWTQASGRKSAQAIQNRIYELLHGIDPGISGWRAVVFRQGLAQILKDPDDAKTHHGIQKFRFVLSAA